MSNTTNFKCHKYFHIGLLVVLVLIGSILAQSASAQQSGITVIPSINHLDLASDPPEYDLTYINTTKTDITLLLSVSDFTELEDSYKISFLEGKDASNYKYSLSSWISFENKTIQLSPGERKSIKVFIDKNRITRGGHYASILAEIVQPKTKKQVGVKAVLSSLLFVRASTGNEIEEAKITSFKPLRGGLEFPDTYTLQFENSGNTYVVPYGLIQVYDPTGALVSTGILNEGSLDALPESIRRYNTKLQTENRILLPGFYSARATLHFGKSNKRLTSSGKFFTQGSFNFVKIGLVLIVILIGLYYFKRRSGNRD